MQRGGEHIILQVCSSPARRISAWTRRKLFLCGHGRRRRGRRRRWRASQVPEGNGRHRVSRAASGLQSRSALDSATDPPLLQSFAISEPQQCTEAQSPGITSIYLQPLQLPLNEVFHLGTQLITRASSTLDERAHEARHHHAVVIFSNRET